MWLIMRVLKCSILENIITLITIISFLLWERRDSATRRILEGNIVWNLSLIYRGWSSRLYERGHEKRFYLSSKLIEYIYQYIVNVNIHMTLLWEGRISWRVTDIHYIHHVNSSTYLETNDAQLVVQRRFGGSNS